MLNRSQLSAKRGTPDIELEERFTAYTPGETLHLMKEPEMAEWHSQMSNFELPTHADNDRPIEAIVFVPCAKTKPWDTATTGLYGAYNEVRNEVRSGELPTAYFVTVSEPLGVVPEGNWGDFPQYDNPGLFRNEVLRAGGLFTADFADIPGVGEKVIVPFDENAYNEAIDKLAQVIASFAKHIKTQNPALSFISFVDSREGEALTTHTDMLARANKIFPFLPEENRFLKKPQARVKPTKHVSEVIDSRPWNKPRQKRASTHTR